MRRDRDVWPPFFDNCIMLEGVRWRRPVGEALRVSAWFSWLMVGWFGSGSCDLDFVGWSLGRCSDVSYA
jgi:hypothetical protein